MRYDLWYDVFLSRGCVVSAPPRSVASGAPSTDRPGLTRFFFFLQAREQKEAEPERAVLDARVLPGRPADVAERHVAGQGHGRFFPVRARRTLLLDRILYVAVQSQVHDLQGQQRATGEWCVPGWHYRAEGLVAERDVYDMCAEGKPYLREPLRNDSFFKTSTC